MTFDLTFDARIRDAFLAASHDRNPLHLDAAYATRTQFGRPIVYGICGVLAALAGWSAGRNFALRQLRIRFERPLLYDTPYAVTFTEKGSDAKIKIVSGATTHVSIALSAEWATAPEAAGSRKPSTFAPLAEPLSAPPSDAAYAALAASAFEFDADPEAVDHLLALAGFNHGQMPHAQILFLLWASYFAGMQVPGRQALFAELTAAFDADTAFPGKIGEIQFDDRFNRIITTGSLSDTASFQIAAFVRPLPVNTGLDEIRRLPLEPQAFADQVVIISGGTRGFGEALAKTIALQGGKIAANYRSTAGDSERMTRELTGYPFQT